MNTCLHTLYSSKEHHKTTELVLSSAGLYKHRQGRQKMSGVMQEGKKQRDTIPQGPCVAMLCSSLLCHSFQDHTKRHPISSSPALKTLSMPNQLTYYWFSLHYPFLAVPSHSNCFPVTLHQS